MMKQCLDFRRARSATGCEPFNDDNAGASLHEDACHFVVRRRRNVSALLPYNHRAWYQCRLLRINHLRSVRQRRY